MPYRVEFVSRSEKDIRRLDRSARERVRDQLASLSVKSRPHGIEQLEKNVYRLRSGDFRIIYEVLDAQNLIIVHKVQKRGEVYRK